MINVGTTPFLQQLFPISIKFYTICYKNIIPKKEIEIKYLNKILSLQTISYNKEKAKIICN